MRLTTLNIGYRPERAALRLAALAQDDGAEIRAIEAGVPILFPNQGGPDAGYRRLSQSPNVRDLLAPQQDRMQRVAYYLYVTNNVAARCVEILVDFICGEGVSVAAEEPAVQETLDEFWHDPWNDLDKFVPQMVQGQSVFGESLVQCYTNPVSGQVRIADTDPLWIDAVEYSTLEGDPGRATGPALAVVLKRDYQEKEAKRLRVVSRDEDPFSPEYGMLRGECFYWPLRKARAATRGISDLFKSSDLAGALEQMIWAAVQHTKHQGAFIWDLLLRGATQEQIDDWLKKNPAGPAAAGVRVHNENTEWKAVSPQLAASEQNRMVQTVKSMILAGFGFPPHWFAEGGDVNRATALEMGDPALKMLTRRQRDVKYQLEEMLRYVISAKIAAGALPENINQAFEVQMPELSVKDQGKIATALSQTVSALSLARAEGLVDEETAANALAIQIQQLGVEADPAEMLRKARAEKEAERARDYRNRNDEPPLPGGRGSDLETEPRALEAESGEENGRWVTINGTSVFIDDSGNITKGPAEFVGKKPADIDGGGSKAERDKDARALRAKRMHVPATRAMQHRADREQRRVAQISGGKETPDNSPTDVIVGRHAIEVKTLQVQKNDKITMHPDSLRRKESFVRRNKMQGHTVVIDARGSRPQFYYREGFGSFRLGAMEVVSQDELRRKFR